MRVAVGLGFFALLVAGCAAPSRAGRALRDAALDPHTWLPAAGALVLGLSDLDDRVGDYARRETPLFGSSEDAGTASDLLLATGGALAATTAALSARDRARAGRGGREELRLGSEAAAVALAGGSALLGKEATGRARPDGSDDESLPSAHATLAASFGALARRNAEWTGTSERARAGVAVGADALTLLVGWARVENGAHHPSDALAGMALGSLVTLFVHDAVVRRPRDLELRAGGPGAFGVTVSTDL